MNYKLSDRVKNLKPWPINTGAGQKIEPIDLKRVAVWNIGKYIVRIYRRK